MNLEEQLKLAKGAERELLLCSSEKIDEVLSGLARLLRENVEKILEANRRDLAKMAVDDALHDRVLLNEERIEGMAKSLEEIAGYESPIGKILEERDVAKGLHIKKVSCPLGVIAAVFEARPNVVVDIFALCFKAQNVCVLKGGSQSMESNMYLLSLIHEALRKNGLNESVCVLLDHSREAVAELLKMDKYLDLVIPRGGRSLIDFVRANSLVPVIETGAGVVHIFIDDTANVEMAADIVFNAKTSRPSVCNAMDTLLIARSRLMDLPKICSRLAEAGVEIFANGEAYDVLAESGYAAGLLKQAEEENFGKEYLSLKMSVKVVGDINEAIEHINRYGSRHSEAIISEDAGSMRLFMNLVDAAAVYHNASTRFTDGGVFGLGAEVGVSTQKLHARGPMGVKELTSYKWEIFGHGQVRG